MAKHIKRVRDADLTERLNQPELFVEKGIGDHNHFRTWLVKPNPEVCPYCGSSRIKVHKLCSKSYKDILEYMEDEDSAPIVSFDFFFYMWRCLNPKCKRIFSKKINFASKHNNVTYRFEDAVFFHVNAGNSYEQTSSILDYSISRQAVGQMFTRWITHLDEQRKMPHPIRHLAIRSGKTSTDKYTIFLNLDNEISVIDILYRVKTADIAKALSKLDCSSVELVVSDCEPTIVDVIKNHFPNAVHVIPTYFWFDLVSAEFRKLAHETLKWCPLQDKMELVLTPAEALCEDKDNLIKLLDMRPSLAQPYADFNLLSKSIKNPDILCTYDELLSWLESTDEYFQNMLSTARHHLECHRREIEAYNHYHQVIPNQLHEHLVHLDSLLYEQRVCSTALLKGRALYNDRANSNISDLHNWTGIGIETVLSRMAEFTQYAIENKAFEEDFKLADLFSDYDMNLSHFY